MGHFSRRTQESSRRNRQWDIGMDWRCGKMVPPSSSFHPVPSGKRLHVAMERSTTLNGTIHYFDWAIFNSHVKLPEGNQMYQWSIHHLNFPLNFTSPLPWGTSHCHVSFTESILCYSNSSTVIDMTRNQGIQGFFPLRPQDIPNTWDPMIHCCTYSKSVKPTSQLAVVDMAFWDTPGPLTRLKLGCLGTRLGQTDASWLKHSWMQHDC